MVITIKSDAKEEEIEHLRAELTRLHIKSQLFRGAAAYILGLLGDTAAVDRAWLLAQDIVADVQSIEEPFKYANRRLHPLASVVDINGVKIGGGHFQIIAGPCSVESAAQLCCLAEWVKQSGAGLLRGGAFKPRTSPYAFQGLQEEGLRMLQEAKRKTGLPIVSEIMDSAHIPLFMETVDLIQVGARNMQNFALLKALGKLQKPILLKRGLANTIDELLMSAEYILSGGNEAVILCERGIRTFASHTRNTLDLSAIPVLKKLTHLPVVVDPSHALGYADLVKPMAMAATVAGADGLMLEVHQNPPRALCDGAQSLTPKEFDEVAAEVFRLRPFACRYPD